MSVELAVITGLKRDINTKLGLTRDFNLTAGEDISEGELLTIGGDGKGYLKYRPNKSTLIDGIRSTLQIPTVAINKLNYRNTLLMNSVFKTTNGYIGVTSGLYDTVPGANDVSIFYGYLDSLNNPQIVTQNVENMAIRDSYNNSGRWRHYQGFLHQIDNNNYILFELFYTDYYDGSAWHYETHLYYRNITLDESTQSISVSSSTELINDDASGCSDDWDFHNCTALVSYDASTIFFVFSAKTQVARIAIDSSNNVSVANNNTTATAANANDGILYVDDGTNKGWLLFANFNAGHIYSILSNTATDVTDARTIATTDADYQITFIRQLDTNKILAKSGDDLYVFEYNTDATVKSNSKISCTNFAPNEVVIPYYRNMGTPNAYNDNGAYIFAVPTYNEMPLDNEYPNRAQYIIKLYQDSAGNYFADKVFKIAGHTNYPSYLTALPDGDFSAFTPVVQNASNNYEIANYKIGLDLGLDTPTFRVNLFAKTGGTAGNTLTATTTDIPIAMTINPGEQKGHFVGIASNLALPLKGE